MFRRASLIAAALGLALGPARAAADGAYFADRDAHLLEPEQKAVVVWDGRRETMVIASKVSAEDATDLERLVWLVPVESATKPEVSAANSSVFEAFVEYFTPDRRHGAMGAAAFPVDVLERKKVDIYDVAVLRAGDAKALLAWMGENGFVLPAAALPVVEGCLAGGERYFIANRINLANRPDLPREELRGRLTRGMATPLRIDFEPPQPVYPLRISAVHPGAGAIEVYVCAPFPAEDARGTMKVESSQPITHRLRRKVAPHLDLSGTARVTRLAYHGELAKLKADAVFGPAGGAAQLGPGAPGEDEAAFDAIFADASIEEISGPADAGRLKEIVGRLAVFAERRPESRFADDAVALAVLFAPARSARREEGFSLLIAARTLEGLLERLGSREIRLEETTAAEAGSGVRSMLQFYAEKGISREHLLLRIAEYYAHFEHDREAAGRIGLRLQEARANFPEHEATQIELFLPERLRFEERFDAGVAAFAAEDWEGAARALEEAAAAEKQFVPCNLMPRCMKTLPAALHLRGLALGRLGRWAEARQSFARALEVAPAHEPLVGVPLGGDRWVESGAGEIRSMVVASYLEEGDVERALAEGRAELQRLRDRGATGRPLALALYNLACAHSRRGEVDEAARHLRRALREVPPMKEAALRDKDLEALRGRVDLEALAAEAAGEQAREKERIETLLKAREPESLLAALDEESAEVRRVAAGALRGVNDPRVTEPLLAALRDPDPQVRWNAAVALRDVADARALEPMVAALADPSADVRKAAAETLGKLKDPRAVEPLVTLAKALDPFVRRAGAVALAEIRGPRALEALGAAVKDEASTVRFGVVETLERAGDPHAAPLFVAMLSDSEDGIRRKAQWALDALLRDERKAGELKETLRVPGVVELLLAALSRAETVPAAARALGAIGEPRAFDPLLGLLARGTPPERAAAAEALGRLHDPRTVDVLVAALKDPDARVRQAATLACARLGDPRAVAPLMAEIGTMDWSTAETVQKAVAVNAASTLPTLVAAMHAGDDRVRQSASQILRLSGEPAAVAALLDAMKDKDPKVRAAAEGALVNVTDPRAVPAMEKALGDPDDAVREACIRALGRIKDPASLRVLTEALKSPDPKRRARVASSWGLSGDERAADPLIEALGDPDLGVRKAALGGLEHVPDPRVNDLMIRHYFGSDRAMSEIAYYPLINRHDPRIVELLLEALGGPDPSLTDRAVRVLAQKRDPRAADALLARLRDQDTRRRLAAAEGLGQLGDARAAEALAAALGDPDDRVRNAVGAALGKIKDPRAFDLLLAALGNEDPARRAAAARGLKWTGDARAVEPLARSLRDPHPAVRLAAAEALSWLRDPRCGEALVPALSDADAGVRAAAARSLGNMREPRAADALAQLLGDADPSVREMARFALGAIGDPRAAKTPVPPAPPAPRPSPPSPTGKTE